MIATGWIVEGFDDMDVRNNDLTTVALK